MTAGSYTVTVKDANGCSATATVKITQPNAIQAAAVATAPVNCNGGNDGVASSITYYGTPPYTYSWSPGGQTSSIANGLSAGSYTVHITDSHGCGLTSSVIISQPALIRDSLIANSVVSVSCNGESNGVATIGAKGGTPPYTFAWSNGQTTATASGLSAGSYTVAVSDSLGCVGTNSVTVTITQPSKLRDSIAAYSCSNHLTSATAGVKGGVSPYTYSWSPAGGTKATATGLSNGVYTVTVTDKNGCTATAVSPTFSCSVAPPNGNEGGNKKPDCCPENTNLYPNPNTGQFTISGLEKGMIIDIYDYLGKKISAVTASDNTMHLSLSAQPNGIYLIRIINTDGTLVDEKKVVKTY
jgi:hypothetical protein